MSLFDDFIRNSDLSDPDDINSLLDLADLVRRLVSDGDYEQINRAINYTVDNGYLEALSWTMEILQEELSKGEACTLDDFACEIGKAIKNYNEFINQLGIDLQVMKNDVETILDENGEVQSFFNIFIYKTRFDNIYFLSSENFDTKDNDFIQYKFVFKKESY